MDTVPVSIEVFGHSDAGRVRELNEDQYLIANLNRSIFIERSSLAIDNQTRLHGVFQGTVLIVADGMGGESAGDHASRLAVQTLTNYVLNIMPWFFRLDAKLGVDLENVLREGLKRCEDAIHSFRDSSPDGTRMGTTVTMAYILWPNLYLVHAGDSRCYLLRGGNMQQLTRDHTVAQLMHDRGQSKQGDDEKYGHVLWNAVGAEPTKPANPDVTKIELSFGDTIMLCSDGLHGFASSERIQQIITSPESVEAACRELVDEALSNGGEDNVTTIVARFDSALEEEEDNELTIREPPPDSNGLKARKIVTVTDKDAEKPTT